MEWNNNLEEGSPAYHLASSDASIIRAVAGPGSGKSFAINRRVLRLLEEGVTPHKILAVTFTRTAAHDLKTEITSLGIEGADSVHTRTLHSHALKILMNDHVLEQTQRTPRMMIPHESEPILRDLDRQEYGPIKNKKVLLSGYLAAWATLQTDDPGYTQTETENHFEEDLLGWFKVHESSLIGEVIPLAVDYLRDNPASEFRSQYDHILVDEFQDLNRSEQELIKLISGDANLVIVGDDDQSIYGFKYAHPQGIQQIQQTFGEYFDVAFDVCRRCPTQVTRMASKLISNNPNRTLGDLNPFETNANGIVNVVQWNDLDSEISGIADFVESQIKEGVVNHEDILILCPRRRIGYRLRDQLTAREIRAKSYFTESKIKEKHVQRSFSLLILLAKPDDKVSLRFLLGDGSSSFRKSQYQKLKELAETNNLSILGTLKSISEGRIERTGLSHIHSAYERIVSQLTELKSAIINNPLDGFTDYFMQNDDTKEDFFQLNEIYTSVIEEIGTDLIDDSEENFDEWFNKVMEEVLQVIALPEVPENIDHVRIMSLHSSKGLSSKMVIITSMIDQLIPGIKSGIPNEEEAINEARRLFFVGITRCKASDQYDGRLIISSFLGIQSIQANQMGLNVRASGMIPTRASRFIREFRNESPVPIRGDELN